MDGRECQLEDRGGEAGKQGSREKRKRKRKEEAGSSAFGPRNDVVCGGRAVLEFGKEGNLLDNVGGGDV